MDFTDEELDLLKGMAEKERNHAERCLNVNNVLAGRQRERDLKRATLLERIIEDAVKSLPEKSPRIAS